MKRNSFCASSIFCFPSVNAPHCMPLLPMADLKLPVFCCSATLMWGRRPSGNCPPLYYYCFYEAKLWLWKLILLCSSVKTLHCISLLPEATLKFAVFCCSATLI
jgi:hypothetical protein